MRFLPSYHFGVVLALLFEITCALVHSKLHLKNEAQFSGAAPYSRLRDDLEIFERTVAAAQGQTVKGPVYPLIVSMTPSQNSRRGHYAYSTSQPKKVPAANLEEPCINVGLTVVGFMSIAQDTHSRHRHRSTERHRWNYPTPCIKFVYVIGVDDLEEKVQTLLNEEDKQYGDIVMLPIHENMNRGKTFKWFQFALQEYPRAAYIAKGDVDAFVHPVHLAQQLSSLPSRNLLYGFDCQHNLEYEHHVKKKANVNLASIGTTRSVFRAGAMFSKSWDTVFMCGMFYLFSRDTVDCAMKSDHLTTDGLEDYRASNWPVQASCPLNFTGDMYHFFDYPGREKGAMPTWGQQLGWNKDAVCIHHLKTDQSWQDINDMLCQTERICGAWSSIDS